MLETRTFRIVFAGEGHGIGVGPESQPDKIVEYSGKAISIAQ
jgi:hypothetical protein